MGAYTCATKQGQVRLVWEDACLVGRKRVSSPALGARDRLRAELKCIAFGWTRRLLLPVLARRKLIGRVWAVGQARLCVDAAIQEQPGEARQPKAVQEPAEGTAEGHRRQHKLDSN
eukprot:scaffold33213_cov60-Phaeocystis_antarctica.AAC.8